jgi:uncharacterized membrane protein YkoI
MTLFVESQRNSSDNQTDTSTTKKKKRKLLIIVPIVIIIMCLSAFVLRPGNVSRQEAVEIALSQVGGGYANRPSRDFERFQRVWAVEIYYDGLVHEVFVSMSSGQVIKVEVDKWD